MGVAATQQIRWKETRDIAQRIDDLAKTMGTPDYDPLITDMSTPFPLEEIPDAKFTLEFELSDPSTMDTPGDFPEISQQRMMQGTEGSATALRLEEPLSNLAENGDLYFRHKEDDCWCMTLFMVHSGPFYYLTEVEEPEWRCSCQSIEVPDWPEKLDYGQKIIPAAYAKDWYEIGYEGDSKVGNPDWLTSKRCEEDGEFKCHYGIKPMAKGPNGRAGFMFLAQREMEGKYVWPIRAKWFDLMKEKVDYILECKNNCGARGGTVIKNGTGADGVDPVYIKDHCPATWCDIVWTMGLGAQGAPGCLTDECKLPWHVNTCQGENCTDTPKLYAHTLNQFIQVLDNIEEWIYPLKDPCELPEAEWELTGSASVEATEGDEWQRIKLCQTSSSAPASAAVAAAAVHHHPFHHGEYPCDASASTTFCPKSYTSLNIVADGVIEAVRGGVDTLHIKVSYTDKDGNEQILLDDEKSSTGSVTAEDDRCASYNYEDLTGDKALVYDVSLPGEGGCDEVTIEISFDTVDDMYNCSVGYTVSFSLS